MRISQRLKRLLAVPVVTIGLLTAGIAAAPGAEAATVSCTSVGTSFTHTLSPGQCIKSTNGLYSLVMQHDGNLVSYRNSDSHPCWASNTSGHPGVSAVMNHAVNPVELDINFSWDEGDAFQGIGSGAGVNISINAHGHMYVGYGAYPSSC